MSTSSTRGRRFLPAFPAITEDPTATKRDLALDAVRSWSLFVVVFGHFIMMIIYWDGNIPATGNTLASGDLWPYVTWLLQVMPLFFVAGGAVNLGSYQRSHASFNQWLWQRTRRLMKPSAIYLIALAFIFSLITLIVPRDITDPLVTGITGPLWFLSVYIAVTALTPLTSKWWQRQGIGSIAVLAALTVLIDYLRLNVAEAIGSLNLIVAWVLVHQFGYWYSRGVSHKQAQALVVGGLTANILLTQILKWYPTSLVGIPSERISNMAPPTVVLVMHSTFLFGLFVLIAPWLRARVSTPRGFVATTRAAMLAMTVYLWHMLILIGWLSLLHLLGADLPTKLIPGPEWSPKLIVPDGPSYWLMLVPSTLGFAAILYFVVRLLWPLEFMNISWFDAAKNRPSSSPGRAIVGSVLIPVGLLGVSGAGFSGFPIAVHSAFGVPISTAGCLVAIGLGLMVLRQPRD